MFVLPFAIVVNDTLVKDAFDTFINVPVMFVLPFAIVVNDTLLKDAFDTFINVPVDIVIFPGIVTVSAEVPRII
jgi:hypothetical protein